MIHDDLIDLKNVYRECRDIDALLKKLFKDGGWRVCLRKQGNRRTCPLRRPRL